METTQSVFVLEDEVTAKYHPVSVTTRWRQERAGRFPKREKIGHRLVAWRRSALEEWATDPKAWAAKYSNPVPQS